MTLGSTQVPVSDWLERYIIHISRRKFPKSTCLSVSREVFSLYYFPPVAVRPAASCSVTQAARAERVKQLTEKQQSKRHYHRGALQLRFPALGLSVSTSY